MSSLVVADVDCNQVGFTESAGRQHKFAAADGFAVSVEMTGSAGAVKVFKHNGRRALTWSRSVSLHTASLSYSTFCLALTLV